MEGQNDKTITLLKRYKIPLKTKLKPFRLIHQKTLLLDDKTAVIMTFNFTKSTFKNNVRNFALTIEDDQRAEEVRRLFYSDWNKDTPVNSGVIITGGESRRDLIQHLNTAKSQIEIYAQTINDYQIIGALAKLARRGIHITIQTSKPISQKQYDYLKRNGVRIAYNKETYIHAKTFLIDNNKAIIGSINLTKPSLENNRELAIVSYDAKVIHTLHETFQADLKSSGTKSSSPTKAALKELLRLLNRYLGTHLLHSSLDVSERQ